VEGGAEAEAESLLAEPAEPIPDTGLHSPVTSPWDCETSVTSGPGLGNTTSLVSGVEQPLLRFATKSEGRDENDALARFLLPDPLTITDAQFMYISRLPMLLNQVHAKRAAPAGASEGTVKGKVPPDDVGQLPM
jgi:hypothetical protein